MKSARLILAALILLGSLLMVTGVLAAGEIIRRSVFGSAGDQIAGSGYILRGTMGQPIASCTQMGTHYGLGAGYWGGDNVCSSGLYLPIVLRDG